MVSFKTRLQMALPSLLAHMSNVLFSRFQLSSPKLSAGYYSYPS